MMQTHYQTENYNDHGQATMALFEDKSLDALIFLIDHGRELEFSFAGQNYFLSRANAEKYVSLWGNGIQQSFDSVAELIEKAVLQSTPFRSAWIHVILQYLL